MKSFCIGKTQFGVSDVLLEIEKDILNLEISGDEDIFDSLTEDDESEWTWALYAPKIYFRDIPYTTGQFFVSEETLHEYDIGLYMMEHCDFLGKIETYGLEIHITGNVKIAGNLYPIAVVVDIDNA